jgi:hypothetical protein
MITLKGTIQNGQVRLSQPADLPDGTEVTVITNGHPMPLGIPDDEWPTDPEGVAQIVARMDRVEPFDMTPAEEADIESWWQKVSQHTLVNQDSAIDGLFE